MTFTAIYKSSNVIWCSNKGWCFHFVLWVLLARLGSISLQQADKQFWGTYPSPVPSLGREVRVSSVIVNMVALSSKGCRASNLSRFRWKRSYNLDPLRVGLQLQLLVYVHLLLMQRHRTLVYRCIDLQINFFEMKEMSATSPPYFHPYSSDFKDKT